MSDHRLLGLCGSLRAGSTNRKLLNEAVRLYAPAGYAEADLRLPLYDGDVEDSTGIPAPVQTLADQIKAADAIIITTPEYNKALSGVLKNALDWLSRVPGGVWADKPVAIMSAAAGRTGGEAAQFSLRLAMVAFRPRLLLGPQMMLANSGAEFDDHSRLTNHVALKTLTGLMDALKAEARRG